MHVVMLIFFRHFQFNLRDLRERKEQSHNFYFSWSQWRWRGSGSRPEWQLRNKSNEYIWSFCKKF